MNLTLSSPDDFLLFHWTLVLVNYPPSKRFSLGADIYVNHPQSPPSHLQDYSTCNNARWFNFFPWFDPKEWCMKNGLHSGGLNPGPLGHESSALPQDHGYSLNSKYFYFLWIRTTFVINNYFLNNATKKKQNVQIIRWTENTKQTN